MKTRQKLKAAYDAEFLATIERAEKQIILARHGRRLMQLLDDSPIVPGDQPHAYHYGAQARQILNDAEDDLRDWQLDPIDLFDTSAPIPDAKSPVQRHSPAVSSPSESRQKTPRERTSITDGSEAEDTTRPANTQGEHEPTQTQGGKGDDVAGAHGWVDEHRMRTQDTEASLSQSSQQLEGSAVLTGSPVSSVDGWRVHANMFNPKQPSVAY